ncbi:MAG: MoaD/ThiS family protein [Cyanobacteriota bacterium]|nr:MoaD/ThiS family protein [Cyanobacteriota bacterium]
MTASDDAPANATVRVRLFASLRDALGWGERVVPLTVADATALDLWRQLGHGEAPPAGVRVAINQEFAAPETALKAGDELAFLPPITGG